MGAKAPLFLFFSRLDASSVYKVTMKTIDYYNQKADEFVASTFHIAMGNCISRLSSIYLIVPVFLI